MEAERNALHGQKTAVEQEKYGLREELVRVEQEKLDIDTEKMGQCMISLINRQDIIRIHHGGIS